MLRSMKTLILRAACFFSIALCALVTFQSAGFVQPLGVGWGDGTRGRAYSIEAVGAIVLRTASGMKAAPPGSYAFGVQMLKQFDRANIQYRRWNMTAGEQTAAPVLGSFAEVRIAPGWTMFLSLAMAALCIAQWRKQRQMARDTGCCLHCGYDLRATPNRCPECGRVPAKAPAA